MLAIAADPAAANDTHEQVGELLRSLPPAVRDTLMSEHYRQGEAVLSYAGKRTRGEILGDPRRSPLQVVKSFGEPEGDWVNKLVFGDNIAVLRALREEKRLGRLKNADGSDGFRTAFIDPPFSTQRDFAGRTGTTAYSDKREGAEFIEFLRERLVLMHAVVTDAYIRSLHTALAAHIKRGLVSVIIPLHLAPTLVADTLTAGGLTVRVLRVPPSASARAADGGIEGFAELSQPASEKQVNLFVQTEGFDFIIQPVLGRKLAVVKGEPRITLTKFESDGRRANTTLPEDGRTDLAMVLVDYDHIDFEGAFDFERVVWSADMEKSTPAWSFNLDKGVLDKRVAVTWVDKYGNEMREVIEPAAWKGGA